VRRDRGRDVGHVNFVLVWTVALCAVGFPALAKGRSSWWMVAGYTAAVAATGALLSLL
jgi:hypothetical protein